MQKTRKTVEANWEPVEASGSRGSRQEAGERQGRRGAGGVGEVWEVRKRSERLWESAEEVGRHRK